MNVVVVIIIIKYFINLKGVVSLFFFWNEKIGSLFLFTLTVFPNQLTLKASSVYRRAL